MNRARAAALLGAWTGLLAAALVFLHRAKQVVDAYPADGSGHVIVVVRYLALATGWYLAATTAISFAAQLLRAGAAVAVAQRMTAAPIHRLTRAAVGAAFAASTVVPTAAAAETSSPPPVMVWVDEEQGHATPALGHTTDTAQPEAREVVIAPGDSLWSLAAARLAEQLHREPSDREVWRYWREVIRVNEGRLRDARVPDLIYPGDRVVLPPP